MATIPMTGKEPVYTGTQADFDVFKTKVFERNSTYIVYGADANSPTTAYICTGVIWCPV